jgi:hypothetical protein
VSELIMRRSSSDTNESSFVFANSFVISVAVFVRGTVVSASTPFGHIRFLQSVKKNSIMAQDQNLMHAFTKRT